MPDADIKVEHAGGTTAPNTEGKMRALVKLPTATATILLAGLSGCGIADRLAEVGKAPALSAIENPITQPGYRPVSMPMPVPDRAIYSPNSLWRTGARAFFKDQRAQRVGDLVTVLVEITDKAQFDNESKRARDNEELQSFNQLYGLPQWFLKALPADIAAGVDLSKIVDLSSNSKSDGTGSIDREETVATKMAAVVTQVLPNGNMVIEGKQEIRVNYDLRELIVAGVIRPEDISSDNTVPISKIAEARVSYGGRGKIMEVQQPRYGQQILDVLLPW